MNNHDSGIRTSPLSLRLLATRSAVEVCVILALGLNAGPVIAAELPAGPLTATSSGGGELPLDQFEVWSRYQPRLEFHQQFGETIGLRDDLTRLGAFVPFSSPHSNWLAFTDLHGLFTEDGVLGSNAGIGIRYAPLDSDLVLGLNCYYDYRDTSVNRFQQISPGVELLGPGWEFRANGYLPRIFDSRESAPNRFVGNFLFTDRFESAMSGFDAEIGVQLPEIHEVRPRVFAGLYHFQAPHRPQVWGWSSRVEADISDAVSMGLSVQNDQLFDTSLNLGVTIRFSGAALLDRHPVRRFTDAFDSHSSQLRRDFQLVSTPHRQRSIVLDQSEQSLAVDPLTGQPLTFLHVAAAGNSDGSFKDPYANLTAALDDPRYLNGDISTIFVRHGGVQTITHTGDVTLVHGSRILGNGPVQMVATQLGERQLPSSGVDADLKALPLIQGRVNLGNNSTFSGFEVRTTTGLPSENGAIQGDGITGFNINNNVVLNIFSHGISLRNINGTGQIADNIADGNAIESDGPTTPFRQIFGINVTSSPLFDGDILNNTADRNLFTGIFVGDTTFRGNIDGNNVNQTAVNDGIIVLRSDFQGDIRNNTSNDSSKNGILLFEDTVFTGNITNNSTNLNQQSGIIVRRDVTFVGDITGNMIAENGESGIGFRERSDFTGTISDNIIIGSFEGEKAADPNLSRLFEEDMKPVVFDNIITTGFGIFFDEDSTATATITRNVLNDNPWAGLFIRDTTFTGDITENTVNGNSADGISILTSNFTGNITGNTAKNNFFGGLYASGTTMTGNIEDNDFSDNGFQGLSINGGSGLLGNISGNTVSNNGNHGLVVSVPTFTGNISDNVVSDNSFAGLLMFVDTLNTNITDNTIDRNGENAVAALTYGSAIAIRSFTFNAGQFVPGTFDGNIYGNTIRDQFAAGVAIFDHMATVDILNNVSSGAEFGGFFIDSTVVSFTGDISGNTTNDDNFFGIGVQSASYTGNITNNTANSNGNGINLFGTVFTGDISGNTVQLNGNGILLGNTTFTGDISGNTGVGNTSNGISIGQFFGNTLTGNIESNTLSGGGGAGVFITDSTLTGDIAMNTVTGKPTGISISSSAMVDDISDNIVNMNSGTGILVSGTSRDVFGNTASNNTRDGISVTGSARDILTNVTDSNGQLGLDLAGSVRNIHDNTASQNSSFGIRVLNPPGTVLRNTANMNGNTGILFQSSVLNGAVSENTAMTNVGAGISALTTGAGTSTFSAESNVLSGNNSGGSELFVVRLGSGAVILTLSGNMSSNTLPAGQFNFDLVNTQPGTFTVTPTGVDAANSPGTVGSSDGSVTIP